MARKNYDGLTSANIGNQFFYRYSFDFWSCLLQLLSLSLLFLALCYKNVRIAYELVVSRLLAFLFAADIGGGEKLKNTLLFVRDTYLTMCVCVLSVKLYEIMVGLVTSFGITGIGKGIVCLLIAYAVIDGRIWWSVSLAWMQGFPPLWAGPWPSLEPVRPQAVPLPDWAARRCVA